jgi:hypothetical protein
MSIECTVDQKEYKSITWNNNGFIKNAAMTFVLQESK